MRNLLARLNRGFTRHPGHAGTPENAMALMHAGGEGMRHRQLHMCGVLRCEQRIVRLAWIREGADLDRPLARRNRFVPA